MFLLTMLACIIGYEKDAGVTTVSIEQTRAAHYYYYDPAIQSSVRIQSYADGETTGHGSGNYFKIGNHKFIVSAAHIITEGETLKVQDYDATVELIPFLIDQSVDLAFFIPKRDLTSVRPVSYRTSKKLDITGDSVVYAGFPADLEKAVFHGSVALTDRTCFMMQSFALPGASGSVVFDNKGMAVGVLSAIKVGMHNLSPFPQLHESLVYVNRLTDYDRYRLEELIVQWKSLK